MTLIGLLLLAACTSTPRKASAIKASDCGPDTLAAGGGAPVFKVVPTSNYRNWFVDSARLADESARGVLKPKREEFLIKTSTKCGASGDGYVPITTIEMCLRAANSVRAYSEQTCEDVGPLYCGRNASLAPAPCKQCGLFLNQINCLSRDGTCNGFEAVGQCKRACEEYYDANDWAPFKDDAYFYNAYYRTYSTTVKCTRRSTGWMKFEAWEVAWARCRKSERDICLASCPDWAQLNESWPGVDNITVCGNATIPEVVLKYENQDTHAYPHDDNWPYGCYILEGKDADSPAVLKFNPNQQSAGDCTDSGDEFGSARCLCARADIAAGLDKLPPKKTTLYDGAPYPNIQCFGNGWCGGTVFNGGVGWRCPYTLSVVCLTALLLLVL